MIIWRDVIRETKGRIFSVTFIKKNGEKRRMTCRVGVRKGVTGKGMNHVPADHNQVVVYDMTNKSFRTVNCETIIDWSFNPKEKNGKSN